MASWWMSCTRMTVQVEIDNRQVIVQAAPVVRRFVGQHIERLADWMRTLGGFRCEPLEQERRP